MPGKCNGAMLFAAQVNVAPLVEQINCQAGKHNKSHQNFPYTSFPRKEGPCRTTEALNLQSSQSFPPWVRRLPSHSVISVNIDVFGFFDKQGAKDKRRAGNDDRVPQAVVHVAGLGHDGKRGGG